MKRHERFFRDAITDGRMIGQVVVKDRDDIVTVGAFGSRREPQNEVGLIFESTRR